MTPRTALWLAWSSWAISVVLTASTLLPPVVTFFNPNPQVPDSLLGNALVVSGATVGAVVASALVIAALCRSRNDPARTMERPSATDGPEHASPWLRPMARLAGRKVEAGCAKSVGDGFRNGFRNGAQTVGA